tara:strand:+ start:284 stop:514 length:231 start_codon:yes stop_codon:yes gene_type:complete
MKKLSLYIFLVLMWCNVGFADEISNDSLNENIKKGYKITKETSSQKIKTFTLKNGKNEVVICVVYLADHDTECWKP